MPSEEQSVVCEESERRDPSISVQPDPSDGNQDKLLCELRADARYLRRLRRVGLWLLVPMIVIFSLRFVYIHSAGMGILSSLMALGVNLLSLYINFAKRESILHRLSEANDVRMIAPLASYRYRSDKTLTQLADKALCALLPRLTASDTWLTSEDRENLRRILKSKNTELVLALLQAYQQIGDVDDLAAVQLLLTRKKLASQVREAAQECLPFLEISADRQANQSLLLRPADRIEEPPAELLRSSYSGAEVKSEELLRSIQGENA